MKKIREKYQTIVTAKTIELDKIKGSRFIGCALPVQSEKDCNFYLEQIILEHPNANHHCFAYSLKTDNKTKYSDAGEPTGSAGKPILAPIIGRNLKDILIIVIRYFGGVKLGVGGLVRAYSKASNTVLDHASIITENPQTKLSFTFNYNQTQLIQTVFSKLNIINQSAEFHDTISQDIIIADQDVESSKALIFEYSNGTINQFKEEQL